MNNTELDQYKALFLEELEDQLQVMDEQLLRLETEGESEQSIKSLFRAAHTIKGSAAAMGFQKMKELTHELEQVLDAIRSHKLNFTKHIFKLLFSCLDCLREMKTDIIEAKPSDMNIQPLVDQLQHCISDDGAQAVQIKDAAAPGNLKIMNIQLTIVSSCEMKLARAMVIYNKLQDIGKVISMQPAMDNDKDDSAFEHTQFLIETELDPAAVDRLIRPLLDIEQVEVTMVDAAAALEPKSKPDTRAMSITEKPKTQANIRVNVDRLEELMNLVGELVIDQTIMNQVKVNLHRKFNADQDLEELGHVTDHINRVVTNLQQHIMKIRMLPIKQLFNRFPRMIRDLSQDLNKEVELTLIGAETELDRSILDELGDPLIHLIRNAIDHGIESPQEREKLGKRRKGKLQISAAHEDNHVVIMVEDDGAGIDPERIKQSAIHKKIISNEEAALLSDQEAVHLIFHAGFSTATSVSEVSGRGVGMDIVRSDIERLNGLIDIHTERGKGTQFKIRLPLTLAIITGLLVNAGNRTFILPMGNVAEIIRISTDEIKYIHGKEVIVNRDRIIPVTWLHDKFNIERSLEQSRKKIPIVIVGTAEKRAALAVDHLAGNQDVVIKSLGTFIGKIHGLSGATILGDGQVALIIDVSDMVSTAPVSL